jgi:hypothetical protein
VIIFGGYLMDSDEIKKIIEDIDNLLLYSQYYFYGKEYKKYKKILIKLKKKLSNGNEEKCVKKGCELY